MRWLAWMVCGILLAQEVSAAPPQWAFRVSFTDKTGSPALSNPQAFLSTRALQRRSQQGIAVTNSDRPVSPAYIDSVLTITGGKMHNTSRWFNECVVLLTDSSKILLLQSKPYISGIEWVGLFSMGLHKGGPITTTGATAVPATSSANKGTGTAAYYGATWNQTVMVNGDYVHDQSLTGQGQLIAVLDLGFSGSDGHHGFDSLRNQGRILDEYNFVHANTDIYSIASVHGTYTLSTMAGWMPGTFVGSAPEAQYALYITDDIQYTDALYELDNLVAGMERADSLGADIITTSTGYNEFTQPYYFIYPKAALDGHSTNVAIAANMAVSKGIFVVTSAGNEGGNTWDFLLTPGDADSTLTVGSVNSVRASSGFSSPGPNSSGRIKPDVCMQGDPTAVFSSGNQVTTAIGTSFATPQLAGWAACIRQIRPTIKPAELLDAINRSADRYANPTAKLGYGIPDFKQVLHAVGVDRTQQASAALTVLPNPFKETIRVQCSLEKPMEVHCVLTDITGRIVLEQRQMVAAGKQEVLLNMPSTLATGMYQLTTYIGQQTFSNKLNRR